MDILRQCQKWNEKSEYQKIIDTIDPFQADQTVAVALAEGHRNTVSP